MITSTAESILATKTAFVCDLVTLEIRRGRVRRFTGSAYQDTLEIVDKVRWTTAPRALRTSPTAPDGGQVYQPIAGMVYQRDNLRNQGGAEVVQLSVSVAGNMPITLSTQQNGTGAFATTLAELALLGLLEGATLTIDQAVVTDLPATPVQVASATYGVLSPDPVREFSGIVRMAKPNGTGVDFEAVDGLILGGGNVPRSAYSPLCRWEFCGAQLETSKCIKQMQLGDTGQPNVEVAGVTTHVLIASSDISIGGNTLTLPHHYRSAAWGWLVPQDGPMMGMRIQLGQCTEHPDTGDWVWEIADTIPWTWSCNFAMIEFQCSKHKGFDSSGWLNLGALNQLTIFTAGRNCELWDSTASFGGADSMPQPEAT